LVFRIAVVYKDDYHAPAHNQDMASMEEDYYQVVITGDVLASVSHRQAVTEFANLFVISQCEAATYFRTAPCAVRGRLAYDQALKYQRVLQRKGIVCDIVRCTEVRPARLFSS
jgi:predicted transcriptional regulator